MVSECVAREARCAPMEEFGPSPIAACAPGAAGVLEVEVVFPHACEVCGSSPCFLLVHMGEEDFEALQKAGEAAMPERHYFCADHMGEAGALRHSTYDPAG